MLLYNRGPMLEMLLSVIRNLLNLISKYCGILLSVCLSGDFSNILPILDGATPTQTLCIKVRQLLAMRLGRAKIPILLKIAFV